METADRTQSDVTEAKTSRISDKIASSNSRCRTSRLWSSDCATRQMGRSR
jgi:hypothetical protein